MKLPGFKRLGKESIPQEFHQLVETIGNTVNSGMEVVYEALNKKVSLRDNLQCTVKDIDVAVDASGSPINPTAIQLEGTARADGWLVIRADNLTDSDVYPEGSPFLSCSQTTNGLLINNITGLQENYTYRLRVVVFQA